MVEIEEKEIVELIINEIERLGCVIVDVNHNIQKTQEGCLVITPVNKKWLCDNVAQNIAEDLD
tara:strand:+ start:1945 stop:2133 length:189 start_codon:yes stop_codon:yes gene_type:complete